MGVCSQGWKKKAAGARVPRGQLVGWCGSGRPATGGGQAQADQNHKQRRSWFEHSGHSFTVNIVWLSLRV
jgi:hypothetical protein